MIQKRRLLSLLIVSSAAMIVGGWFLFLWKPNLVNADASWDSVSTIFHDQDNLPDRQTSEQQDAMIRHAATCERAIIFVHADWSLSSVIGLLFYDDYSAAYLQQPDRPFVDFHYMDYSTLNRAPQRLEDLTGWHKLKHSPNSALLHGNGELIYLENGRVIAVEAILYKGRSKDECINQAVDWTNRLVGVDG